MRKLMLILIFSLFPVMLMASSPDDKDVWLGVGAGADQHFMFDLGIPVAHSGVASWGFHLGAVGLASKPSTDGTGSAGSSKETDFNCLQVGGWSDWGRAYAALGAEHLSKTVVYYSTNRSNTVDTTGMGAYVKLGYRISEHVSIYASAGTQSKLLGGLGLHF